MFPEEENLLKKAQTLIDLNRAREAVPILSKALGRNPQNFHAMCLLALCFLELKENEKALEHAEKAVAISPENEWGHRLRGLSLGEMGKNKEALSAAEEAARLAPYEPIVLQSLANAWLRCGKPENAKPAAEKMLEIAPELEGSHFTMGNVYLASDDYHLAEKHFLEVLRINPNSADARNNLGILFMRKYPNVGMGIEHFAEAVKLEPNKTLPIENLRVQLSILPQLSGIMILFPIVVIGVLIIPFLALGLVMFLLGGAYQLFTISRMQSKSLQELPPEFRVLFKSESYKIRFFRKAKFFWNGLSVIFYKIRLGYLCAFAALFIRIYAFYSESSALWLVSFLIYLVSVFIIGKKFKAKKIFEE